VTAPAIGWLTGSVELTPMRVRMTIEAPCSEFRPLESLSSVEGLSAVTLPAGRFDVSLVEAEACLVMIELDAHPALDRVTLLAAPDRHEAIQLTAMCIIVAIQTRN
jgi:hypothetical protein